jgi:AraC-like DNA-binding protein
MSRSAFAKRFNEVYDQTPMEFVARARLHRAAALLRGTDLPVKLIASSLGYSSRSHFSRAFRAAYGDDPSGFRRRMAQARVDPPPDGALGVA